MTQLHTYIRECGSVRASMGATGVPDTEIKWNLHKGTPFNLCVPLSKVHLIAVLATLIVPVLTLYNLHCVVVCVLWMSTVVLV